MNIFDIAREAGVSIATVSRVLSGRPGVRETTREKVTGVADKYGYKPNMIAAGLSRKRSGVLGIVLPMLDNPFYAKLCVAAQQQAQAEGFSTLLFQMKRGDAIPREFIDSLVGKRLDGVLISGDVMDSTSELEATAQIVQLARHMPVVTINPTSPDMPCVQFLNDLCGAARTAIRHLKMLGHERIALLGGDGDMLNVNSREQGYIEEARAEHLPRLYPLTPGQTPETGESALHRLFARCPQGERPTALFCFNDLVAMGALRALRAMSLRVPQDIALVGCDNLVFDAYLDPPLTSVDLRVEEVGRTAISTLIQAQAAPLKPFQQVFDCRLIVRESCGVGLDRVFP